MAHIIDDTCIACGSCQPECPVECITEGEIYHINAEECIDCGACAAVCPSDSIHPEE